MNESKCSPVAGIESRIWGRVQREEDRKVSMLPEAFSLFRINLDCLGETCRLLLGYTPHVAILS
jgi:hypothetical protein